MTPSESEEVAADEQPKLPRCYPHCRGKPWYGGNKEALAWILDTCGRGFTIAGGAAFLAPTLLRLAKEEAGCLTEPPEGETDVPECEGKIYGVRPSSLLTTYTIIVGITSALFLPLMGSIVDFTPHRRLMGRVFAFTYLLFLLPQVFINANTLLAVVILQFILTMIGWGHATLAYAYLPELTSDEKVQNKYLANFTVVQFGSLVLFLATIVGISLAMDKVDDDIFTARLSMSMAFVLTSCCYAYAWSTFETRPAARKLPENASIWTEGFKQLWRTSKMISRDYRSIGWFYVAVATGDAAIGSLGIILVTYFTDVLLFTSFDTGISVLVLLIGSVPGGMISGWFVDRYENVIWSSLICCVIVIINTFLASAILTGPGQQLRAYGLTAIWGLGTGWKWSSDKLMSSTLIPPGQDAELMGLYLFAGQCLTWAPPLIYTGLNEAGVSQRVNIACLNIYIIFSVGAYLCMGKYEDVLATAKLAKAIDDDGERPVDLPETAKIAKEIKSSLTTQLTESSTAYFG